MDTRELEAALAKIYQYKKLDPEMSKKYRKIFEDNIPTFLNIKGNLNQSLYTTAGSLLCNGYQRIVVGDYGAFIEYKPSQANNEVYIVKSGQEYRIYDPRYSKNVKYYWYTIHDGSNIKIYSQQKKVSYADYIPHMYYVSVHEVRT